MLKPRTSLTNLQHKSDFPHLDEPRTTTWLLQFRMFLTNSGDGERNCPFSFFKKMIFAIPFSFSFFPLQFWFPPWVSSNQVFSLIFFMVLYFFFLIFWWNPRFKIQKIEPQSTNSAIKAKKGTNSIKIWTQTR